MLEGEVDSPVDRQSVDGGFTGERQYGAKLHDLLTRAAQKHRQQSEEYQDSSLLHRTT
jgi:hypothetical protein